MKQQHNQTAADQTADVIDDVADGIRTAAKSVGGSVRGAAHAVHEAATHAAGALEESYDTVGQFARNSVDRTRAKARLWEKSLEQRVRDNPKKSLLVAVALGAVVASWWKQ